MSSFEIDTKATCLLCLSANIPNLTSKDKALDSDLNSTTTAFKMLLRYLKVNFTALINPSTGGTGKYDNLVVALCDECSSSTIDFLQLFQEFESIRLQLDLVVGQLHEFMEKGGKDPDRVREFRRRMDTGKVEDESSSKIVDTLRKETMKKAALRVNCSVPRVVLQRTREHEEEPPAGNNVKTETSPLNTDKNVDLDIKQEPKEAEPNDFMVDPEPVVLVGETGSVDVAEDQEHGNDSLDDIIGTPSDKLVLTEQVQMTGSQQWECEYCGYNYSKRSTLRNHQMNKHTVSFLTAEGSTHPGISEQDFNAAVADIMGERTASANECPICGISGLKHNYQVRTHLFRNHLPNVISAVEKIKVANENPVDSSSKDVFEKHCVQLQLGNTKRWKCIPCGKCFYDKGRLQTHQLQMHMTIMESSLTTLCSEQKITTMMKNIVRKSTILSTVLGAPLYKCHLCGKGVWMNLKIHLLKFHLEDVIRDIEESPGGTPTQRGTQRSTQRSTQRRRTQQHSQYMMK